ncbi:hypothetical protein [Kingella potus]|nr:hypothetical protein [Kingella potus]
MFFSKYAHIRSRTVCCRCFSGVERQRAIPPELFFRRPRNA